MFTRYSQDPSPTKLQAPVTIKDVRRGSLDGRGDLVGAGRSQNTPFPAKPERRQASGDVRQE